MGQQHDLKFDFYYLGGYIKTMIYDETQYKYKKHMAPPAKVDHSRSILSPMPGAVVSVNVVVGQVVSDG
jgi:biotin carboxyl carrier protein